MDDEPLTERRPVTGPRVFGYLRHVTGGAARHTALTGCITEYCRRHELTLCGVFTDREPAVAFRSPAFVGLLDALELPDTYGTVTPALGHLGPRPVAAERKRRISATGARLITVRSTRPTASDAPSFRLQQQGGT
ncbi:hypothetical protein BN159_3927 [Streptomyces davaonensis JCM 4913]|uniref:Resolvase/invertase-type recombinase catalytic domain-containing protein n=1 Tax=Streptomyces davaonensis (strain DSM 101723 / JCM 4913 / KCC S-0913 / 768) TaxID=1214101 RepID=K4QW80_STRDJ|nr:hypothetical protein [Streptomyces davaonensis]CCK28306.1 hypothetical protein BN159_3927 [Streptomyces davaonensis JCM 4913]